MQLPAFPANIKGKSPWMLCLKAPMWRRSLARTHARAEQCVVTHEEQGRGKNRPDWRFNHGTSPYLARKYARKSDEEKELAAGKGGKEPKVARDWGREPGLPNLPVPLRTPSELAFSAI